MKIAAYVKTSLVDYEGHVGATIFTKGCNMNCDYCHNKDLETQASVIEAKSILTHLKIRKGILTGVTITGGEPTLYDDLPELIRAIKNIGYKVKLDTNGTNPNMLKYLVDEGLIDYVAMDLKTLPSKYRLLTGLEFNAVDESFRFIQTLPDYEFRTTMYPEVTFEDVLELVTMVEPKHYILQQYRKNGKEAMVPYQDKLLVEFCRNNNIRLRGID